MSGNLKIWIRKKDRYLGSPVEIPLKGSDVDPEKLTALRRTFRKNGMGEIDTFQEPARQIGAGRNTWSESKDYRPLTHSNPQVLLHIEAEEKKEENGSLSPEQRERLKNRIDTLRNTMSPEEFKSVFGFLLKGENE